MIMPRKFSINIDEDFDLEIAKYLLKENLIMLKFYKPLIIAEIGLSHDGDIKKALNLIYLSKNMELTL